ncbi:MFS transporter [Kitasatospora sp. NPDC098663]|uniref:MFS transporter n=1 Tax=Kitasatospora sp. NPDC098663 TaxID=3364096 RepID=UPI003800958D
MPRPTAAGRTRNRAANAAERDWMLRCYTLRAGESLAAAVVMYAAPLLVLNLTHSTALAGLAFLLEWLPRLAAIAGAGPTIDRYSPRTAVLTTSLLRGVTALATMVGLAAGAGVWLVLVFGVVAGMLAETAYLANEAVGAEATRRAGHNAYRVQSVLTGTDRAALLLGPLIGGALLLAGPALLLAAVAILSAVTVTVAASVRTHRPHLHVVTDPVTARPLASLATGMGTLRRTPALAWLVGALASANLAGGLAQVSTAVTVARTLHHSSAAVGALWSIAAACSLAAVAATRRAVDRWGLFTVGSISAAAMCTATFASALAPDLPLYATAVALLMAAQSAATVVLRTVRAHLMPERAFAATLATTVLLVLAPLPLAGLLVALWPGDHQGLLVAVTGLIVSAGTLTCFRGLRRHRTAWQTTDDTERPLKAA